ncbi:hypothetical protein ACFQ1O_06750 [Pseudofulvibacter geojedonensis]|uniref:Uncharacterized protein n=1 Tax=Pseudofulvibacter geojedonensis TaxID=1123758 RepID=A0ABW3I1V5_9FLAO
MSTLEVYAFLLFGNTQEITFEEIKMSIKNEPIHKNILSGSIS